MRAFYAVHFETLDGQSRQKLTESRGLAS